MVLHLGLTDFDWFSNHRYLANATLFTYVCRISELKTAARVFPEENKKLVFYYAQGLIRKDTGIFSLVQQKSFVCVLVVRRLLTE